MWLLKTEPSTYSYDDLEREGRTVWDGVKNPVALRNLRAVKKGDRAVVYHTGDEKAAVGVAEVTREAYADPKSRNPRLLVVDLVAVKRLPRAVTLKEIKALPVENLAAPRSHLYLWVPNALLPWGLDVLEVWGFSYKANLVCYKVRADGGPDRRGVGFYFRNVTELVLFGVRGSIRTRQAGRRQANLVATRKREHSRKPEQLYHLIEDCSPGPYLELFARYRRPNWTQWGDDVEDDTPLLSPQRTG